MPVSLSRGSWGSFASLRALTRSWWAVFTASFTGWRAFGSRSRRGRAGPPVPCDLVGHRALGGGHLRLEVGQLRLLRRRGAAGLLVRQVVQGRVRLLQGRGGGRFGGESVGQAYLGRHQQVDAVAVDHGGLVGRTAAAVVSVGHLRRQRGQAGQVRVELPVEGRLLVRREVFRILTASESACNVASRPWTRAFATALTAARRSPEPCWVVALAEGAGVAAVAAPAVPRASAAPAATAPNLSAAFIVVSRFLFGPG